MKTFTKTLPNLCHDGVLAVCEKYTFLNQHFSHHPIISTPTAISCGEREITFQWLPIHEMTSLRDAMRTQSKREVTTLLHRIGDLIAKLHAVLQTKGYIHGDLWPENIYLHDDRVLFIDFEPHNTDLWQTAIWNNPEADLAHFIALTETLFPWRYGYPVFRSEWYDAFLTGYREAGGSYDARVLHETIKENFQRNIKGVFRNATYPWYRKIAIIAFRYLTLVTNKYLR